MPDYNVTTQNVDLPDVTAGDDFPRVIRFRKESGEPYDISSWTITSTVKEHLSDSDTDALIQDTATIVNAEEGKAQLRWGAADTDGLSGEKWYDLQVEVSSGDKYTVMRGNVYFQEEVTQS